LDIEAVIGEIQIFVELLTPKQSTELTVLAGLRLLENAKLVLRLERTASALLRRGLGFYLRIGQR
jgi:hypothetical protein